MASLNIGLFRPPEIPTEAGGAVVLYAQWTKMPETATLTFDLGGGTLDGKTGSITMQVKVGSQIEIPAAPTREGYTFKYWQGSEYYPGDKYRVKRDHTFTAVWEKNAEGGSGGSGGSSDTTRGSSAGTGDHNGMLVMALSACTLVAAGALVLASTRRRRDHAYSGKHVKR